MSLILPSTQVGAATAKGHSNGPSQAAVVERTSMPAVAAVVLIVWHSDIM